MRDFYKILGLKEDASEEEIRERWIELTKQYHPDRGQESTSDEKIREINEAYQVLKHSSTRVEYDLKRTFSQRNRRRKRTVHFKRWGVPASILIILIVVGVIYIKNFETNQISQIDKTNQRNKIDQINQKDQINEKGQRDQADKINETNQTNQMSQTKPDQPDGPEKLDRTKETRETRKTRKDQITEINQRNKINHKDQINRTNQKDRKDVVNPITRSVAVAATIKKVQLPQPPQNPISPLPVDVVTNKPTPSINQIDQTDQRNKINQIIQRNQINEVIQTDQKDFKIEIAQFKPPSLLATEDEVKKFFDDYVNYYNRKDAKGILSLFSSKAIQNQKDGLGEIRKIYAVFFGESQEIRYSLQEMKIEIYENAVDVKARYEIEQVVRETGEKEVWRGLVRWVLSKEDGKLKILSMDYKYQRPL